MTYPTPWQTYDPKAPGRYRRGEDKVWEHAVFDSAGNQVGKIVRGVIGYTGRDEHVLSQYGLVRKERQIKKYVEPAKRAPERKEMHTVTTETYDIDGNLMEKTMEGRMVYWNSKGPYIKTRSNGNPRITDPENFLIRYETRMVSVRAWGRSQPLASEFVMKPRLVLVTPEEFEAKKGL